MLQAKLYSGEQSGGDGSYQALKNDRQICR
jgi:hypothetical protein